MTDIKYEKCHFCGKRAQYNDIVFGEIISVCEDHFSPSSMVS